MSSIFHLFRRRPTANVARERLQILLAHERASAGQEGLVAKLREEYKADIDIRKLASELVIDAVVPGDRLRAEITQRFARYAGKREMREKKKHMVPPV